jgi:hypothetical protein
MVGFIGMDLNDNVHDYDYFQVFLNFKGMLIYEQ